jgi:hypothetical protein
MASILRVKDKNGNIIDIPAIQGEKGDPYELTDADKLEIVNAVLDAIPNELPEVAEADNGKFLMVSEGTWAAVAVPSAEEAVF